MQPPDHRNAVLALPAPELDLTFGPGMVVLTPHAVQRYRERAEGGAAASRRAPASGPDCDGAVAVSAAGVDRGRAEPGRPYGYSPGRPDVCLLLRRQVLVTVLSRRFLLQAGARQPLRFYG